jgi:hypothetical protein
MILRVTFAHACDLQAGWRANFFKTTPAGKVKSLFFVSLYFLSNQGLASFGLQIPGERAGSFT